MNWPYIALCTLTQELPPTCKLRLQGCALLRATTRLQGCALLRATTRPPKIRTARRFAKPLLRFSRHCALRMATRRAYSTHHCQDEPKCEVAATTQTIRNMHRITHQKCVRAPAVAKHYLHLTCFHYVMVVMMMIKKCRIANIAETKNIYSCITK